MALNLTRNLALARKRALGTQAAGAAGLGARVMPLASGAAGLNVAARNNVLGALARSNTIEAARALREEQNAADASARAWEGLGLQRQGQAAEQGFRSQSLGLQRRQAEATEAQNMRQFGLAREQFGYGKEKDARQLGYDQAKDMRDFDFEREKFGVESGMEKNRVGLERQRVGFEGDRIGLERRRVDNDAMFNRANVQMGLAREFDPAGVAGVTVGPDGLQGVDKLQRYEPQQRPPVMPQPDYKQYEDGRDNPQFKSDMDAWRRQFQGQQVMPGEALEVAPQSAPAAPPAPAGFRPFSLTAAATPAPAPIQSAPTALQRPAPAPAPRPLANAPTTDLAQTFAPRYDFSGPAAPGMPAPSDPAQVADTLARYGVRPPGAAPAAPPARPFSPPPAPGMLESAAGAVASGLDAAKGAVASAAGWTADKLRGAYDPVYNPPNAAAKGRPRMAASREEALAALRREFPGKSDEELLAALGG